MTGITAAATSSGRLGIVENRRGDRRKNYKQAEEWYSKSRRGMVTERRRSIRREEDVDRFQYLIWYQDPAERNKAPRQIILDRITLFLRRDGERQIIDLTGELSHIDHNEVREIFDTITRRGIPEVVVNMSSLKCIDSTGLGLLVGLRLSQRNQKGTVRLVGVPDTVYRTILSCQLQKLFCIESR